MKLTWPLFKFLKPEHATSMLQGGVVRVGTLHEYRDPAAYGQKTLDLMEGQRRIVIHGPVSNRTELLARIGLRAMPGTFDLQGSIVLNQEWPDCNVYCASGAFFTSTVRQSVDDGKTSCVAILEPERFFQSFVQSELGAPEFAAPCEYGRRVVEFKGDGPWPDSPTIRCPPAFLKGIEYQDQREFRAIWTARPGLRAAILSVPITSDLLLPIDFDELDAAAVLRREHKTVGVRILTHSGREGFFSIQIPGEVFSVVVADINGKDYIAFVPESPDRTFVGGEGRHTDFEVRAEGGVILFAGTVRSDVTRLRFFSADPR